MRQCIKTGDDDKYLTTSSDALGEPWRRALQGRGMGRYTVHDEDLWLRYGDWLARNWQNQDFFERPKIAIRETGSRLSATLDRSHRYFLSSLYSVYFKSTNQPESLEYLLGILNSRFASWLASIFALSATKGAFTKFRTNQLAPLPIRTIDFSEPQDKKKHDRMVHLVDHVMGLHVTLKNENNPERSDYLQQQVLIAEKQIDFLVYDLYELSQEEIECVEHGA